MFYNLGPGLSDPGNPVVIDTPMHGLVRYIDRPDIAIVLDGDIYTHNLIVYLHVNLRMVTIFCSLLYISFV